MDVESENKRLKRDILGYKMVEWDGESDEGEDEDGYELDMIRAERDMYKKEAEALSKKVEKLLDGVVSIWQQCNKTFGDLKA